MKEKILRIHFNDVEPNVAEMAEILPEAGFRPLTDATPSTLPDGAVVVIYNNISNTLSPLFIIGRHLRNGFSYMLFNDLNNSPALEYLDDFRGKFYKVLFQLPVVDSQPQLESLPQAIQNAGFCPLNKATPEDLPEGAVALLYADSKVLIPVIVRVLSTSNKKLLYLHQGIVVGDWHSNVIMDHLNPFDNYLYKVIS